MRTINEIKAGIEIARTQRELDLAWLEWFRYIAFDIEPDRLEAICQAEKEGRCVVLPRKVGDAVYGVAYGCGAKDSYGDEGERCHDCSGKGNCDQEGWHINELKFTISLWGNHSHMFGESMFITREAAEAALKEAKDET